VFTDRQRSDASDEKRRIDLKKFELSSENRRILKKISPEIMEMSKPFLFPYKLFLENWKAGKGFL
jgi:hypothetical protein